MIYFDHNATTPLAPEVETVCAQALRIYGNPSSVHRMGREARRALQEAREKIAACLKTSESHLVFTSGGTESINSSLLGCFLPLKEKKHLIVSSVEHSAVLETARYLESLGVEVTYLSVNGVGALEPAQVADAIRSHTAMIAVMFANNETGNLYPIKEIGEIARAHGIPYLCDAVQAVGKIPLDLSSLPVDYLAASGHKFHGPKGVGFLYLAEPSQFKPLLHGGRQEWGRRAGTENVMGILGMAAALELAQKRMLQDAREVGALRDRLESGLVRGIPGTTVHGDPEHRLFNTLNLRMAGVSGESALMNLDLAGIAISMGSACESGSVEPSHVLLAMGLNPQDASRGLRFTLSRYNTQAEVDQALEIIPKLVEKIRATL